LHYAIDNKAENFDIVGLLIDNDADINKETTSEGFTPLIFAVTHGHKNIVKKLVDLGAKLDSAEFNNLNTALHIACIKGDIEIVKSLATI
jgi:ankyrin repeat protein